MATKTRYFHTDHLGSISVVTDESGAVVARYSYDAWGKRQVVSGEGEDLHHGYNGHEHLDNGFVHMNGRLYDPVLGRFISADPYIQDGSDSQGFNRYSYVNNNPLSFTDPSGYWSFRKFIKSVAKFAAFPTPKNTFEKIRNQPGQAQVDRFIMNNPVAYAVGQIAIGAATWICGGCGAAAWSAYYSYAATGSGNAAFKAALITYATSLAFNAAGSTISNPYALVAAHAAIGCASAAAASGGECGAGALSAGFSKLGTFAFDGYDAGIGGVIASSVIGGTASVLGGGKFANGAITGAFGYLFNCLAHEACAKNMTRDSRGGYLEQRCVGNECFTVRLKTLCGDMYCQQENINVDWSASKAYQNALHQNMAEDLATAASAVALRCPTCLSGKIAGGVATGAGVTDAYLGRDATPIVGMTVGAKVTDFALKAGLSGNAAGRMGIIVDQAIGWFK